MLSLYELLEIEIKHVEAYTNYATIFFVVFSITFLSFLDFCFYEDKS